MECAPRERRIGRHEPVRDIPIAGDTDHSMNALNANPTAHGSRMASGDQQAMRSIRFRIRAVPSMGAVRAAASINSARIRNAAGDEETGAENHSSTASRRRMATAPPSPGPAMKPRASAMNLRGRRTPYRKTTASNTERMARTVARARAIGAQLSVDVAKSAATYGLTAGLSGSANDSTKPLDSDPVCLLHRASASGAPIPEVVPDRCRPGSENRPEKLHCYDSMRSNIRDPARHS